MAFHMRDHTSSLLFSREEPLYQELRRRLVPVEKRLASNSWMPCPLVHQNHLLSSQSLESALPPHVVIPAAKLLHIPGDDVALALLQRRQQCCHPTGGKRHLE